MVLEPLYEQDFLDCSYGFRPKRSAHLALAEIRNRLMDMGGGWVLDVDIRQFFDSLDHAHLRGILAKRMRDGVIKRLIGKWLNAGVVEEGQLSFLDAGTPQGGVVSPLLANIYLHEVLDVWFEKEVKPRLRGRAFLVRYADDFVMGFAWEEDAKRVLDVLPKRFGKYGLALHPDKTRMLDFRRPKEPKGPDDDEGPGSFDFLGFTHYWTKSRKGFWVIKQKTSKSRFTRALKRIKEWCRLHRHASLPAQQRTLSQKLKGHFAYYGISGNAQSLSRFRTLVQKIWRKWLARRSQKARSMNWERFQRMLKDYPLPPPRAIHSIYLNTANP